MIKNKNIKLMGVFASALLIIIVITASFAYFGSFNVNLNNNIAVNVNSVSPGNAIFTSNATQLNLQVPAANMSLTASNNTVAASSNTATLSVSLTSGSTEIAATCTYDIVYEYDSSSYIYGGTGTNHVSKNSDKEITLQVSEVNGTNNFASEKNFDYDSNWSELKRTLVSGATIESDGTLTTQNISITGKYYNLTISQSSLEGKSFTGKIYVTNNKCETVEKKPTYLTLLEAYGGEGKIVQLNNTAFNNVTTANDKGVYKATDDLGISYYYRGAVNNNWVKFGKDGSSKDMYWRIIRINGDNSIRMIYSGTNAPTAATSVIMTGDTTAVGHSVYNTVTSGAEYTGYMYQKNYQRNNVNNSTIKNKVDEWYAKTTLASTDSIKVVDSIFCNDRDTVTNWASKPGANLMFNGRDRNVNSKNPSLKCNNDADKFTVSKDKSNKALRYPVGLITIDEVAMAGGCFLNTNKNYYLYTGIFYYTMTPNFIRRGGAAFVFLVDQKGDYPNYAIGSDIYIRPVINLNGDVKFKGSGTYDDIYEVVE